MNYPTHNFPFKATNVCHMQLAPHHETIRIHWNLTKHAQTLGSQVLFTNEEDCHGHGQCRGRSLSGLGD